VQNCKVEVEYLTVEIVRDNESRIRCMHKESRPFLNREKNDVLLVCVRCFTIASVVVVFVIDTRAY
jgi:hypothetical protein